MTLNPVQNNLSSIQQLEFLIHLSVKNEYAREKISALFLKLVGNQIQKISYNIENDEYHIQVELKNRMIKFIPSRSTTLYIPKNLNFRVQNYKGSCFIHFSEDFDNRFLEVISVKMLWKKSYQWEILSVLNDKFEFMGQYKYGLLIPLLGACKTDRFIPVETLLSELDKKN